MKKYLKFEYFYIVIVIIWEPLLRFILKVDGAGRSVLFLTVLLILLFVKKKEFLRIAITKPILFWGLWVLYAFSNTLIKGYYHDDLPMYGFFTLLFVPYVLMTIITYLSIHNQKRIINVLIFGMYFAIMIILIFDKRDSYDRLGSAMNSNTIGIMSLVLTMLLYLKYFKKSLTFNYLLLLSILPLITIITTGSRTAFGGLLLLILTHFILHRSKNILITAMKFSVLIVLLLLPLNIILNHTELGERIQSTTEQAEEGVELETGIPILDKFGDRGMFYYLGWKVFMENPVSGIGLDNYKYYVDGEQEQHSEYMIQLAELGIIGSTLFILFYTSIFKNLFRIKNKYRKGKEVEIYIAYVIIILAMITATRMFRVWYLFSIIGLVSGYIYKTDFIVRKNVSLVKKVSKGMNLLAAKK